MAAAFEDVTNRLGIFGAFESASEELAEPEDGVQRGAKFMAHAREKIVLRVICGARSRLCRTQGFGRLHSID